MEKFLSMFFLICCCFFYSQKKDYPIYTPPPPPSKKIIFENGFQFRIPKEFKEISFSDSEFNIIKANFKKQEFDIDNKAYIISKNKNFSLLFMYFKKKINFNVGLNENINDLTKEKIIKNIKNNNVTNRTDFKFYKTNNINFLSYEIAEHNDFANYIYFYDNDNLIVLYFLNINYDKGSYNEFQYEIIKTFQRSND
ncbi:hypothetical protein [Epilithonimonas sp.]|uniref:hypothetical protein n=1 Tax=Epilithonimonas sp. TaxID=2894511 RepID=UPI002FDE74B6